MSTTLTDKLWIFCQIWRALKQAENCLWWILQWFPLIFLFRVAKTLFAAIFRFFHFVLNFCNFSVFSASQKTSHSSFKAISKNQYLREHSNSFCLITSQNLQNDVHVLTSTWACSTTLSSSNVKGCSGSLIFLIKCNQSVKKRQFDIS